MNIYDPTVHLAPDAYTNGGKNRPESTLCERIFFVVRHLDNVISCSGDASAVGVVVAGVIGVVDVANCFVCSRVVIVDVVDDCAVVVVAVVVVVRERCSRLHLILVSFVRLMSIRSSPSSSSLLSSPTGTQ